MANPPAINFTIPFVPVAVRVVVNSNGVQSDGTNVPVPDVAAPLILGNFTGPTGFTAAVDPADNRRVIVTPGLLAPGSTPMPWSFRISVAGKIAFTTVSGTTPAPADLSGVTWDGNPVVAA